MGENRGIRTRVLLVAAMALIIAGATFGSLLIVRHQLQDQVTQRLYQRSVAFSYDVSESRDSAP